MSASSSCFGHILTIIVLSAVVAGLLAGIVTTALAHNLALGVTVGLTTAGVAFQAGRSIRDMHREDREDRKERTRRPRPRAGSQQTMVSEPRQAPNPKRRSRR